MQQQKTFAKQGKNLIIIARRKEVLENNPEIEVVIQVFDLSVVTNVYQLYKELKAYQIET